MTTEILRVMNTRLQTRKKNTCKHTLIPHNSATQRRLYKWNIGQCLFPSLSVS